VVGLFLSPLLCLIVGAFFLSISASVAKMECSWPLWLYYMLVGCAFVWMCVTAGLIVYVYKIREDSLAILVVPCSDVNDLIAEAQPEDGKVTFAAYRAFVDRLVKVNQNKATTSSMITSEFRPLDQYKGGLVPVKEIKQIVSRLTPLPCCYQIIYASSIGNLALLVSSLIYGTVYAVEKHNHACDPTLQKNMEHSLFTLWLLFGVLVASLCTYHFSSYCKSKGPFATSVPEKAGYTNEGLLDNTHKAV
jgi:hypothetical protein